jgi:hypothetical protein
MLVALERIMHDPTYWIADRVKASHDLYLNYSRLRWNDGMWLSSMKLDKNEVGEGYLEAETLVTKTSNTVRKRTTFLPIVTPIQLLETADFGTLYLELRAKAGLPEIGTRDSEGNLLPTLPTVDRHGNFTQTPLSSSDAGKWMRELLSTGKHAVQEEVAGITSHGLKATTLAWAARHGGVTPYERKLLGYHADKSEDSMHTYSRDAMAVPMRKYCKIIEDVAFGIFDPDSTRSGHFKPGGSSSSRLDRAEPREVGPEWEQAIDDSSKECVDAPEYVFPESWEEVAPESISDGTSSEDSESSSEEEGIDDFMKDLPEVDVDNLESFRGGSKSVGLLRFVHTRLKTVHAGHVSNYAKLACGRPLTSGFRYLQDPEESFPYPKCSDCFGRPGKKPPAN